MTAARTATVRISLRSVFCQYSGAPRFIIEPGVRDSHRTASDGPNRERYKSPQSVVSFPLRTAILYTYIFVFPFFMHSHCMVLWAHRLSKWCGLV